MSEANDKKQIGEEYIIAGGCPKCGADLKVMHGIAVVCEKYVSSGLRKAYESKGERTCDHALMGG